MSKSLQNKPYIHHVSEYRLSENALRPSAPLRKSVHTVALTALRFDMSGMDPLPATNGPLYSPSFVRGREGNGRIKKGIWWSIIQFQNPNYKQLAVEAWWFRNGAYGILSRRLLFRIVNHVSVCPHLLACLSCAILWGLILDLTLS